MITQQLKARIEIERRLEKHFTGCNPARGMIHKTRADVLHDCVCISTMMTGSQCAETPEIQMEIDGL